MAELLARISSAELTEWMAYERVEGPVGPRRGDYYAAMVSATVANSVRALGGKRGSKKLSDYLITWDQGRRRLSGHDLLREIKSINRALGGAER